MLRVFRRCKPYVQSLVPGLNRTTVTTEGDSDGFKGPIPREKLSISFARSSGPGGQNVNKLNTKAEIRFHVDSADWLSERIKERLQKLFKTRINRDGELIVTSQKHRTQHQNVEDAILKLHECIQEAGEVTKGPSEMTISRIRHLKKRAERQRLIDKKYHSEKKENRDNIDLDS